MARMTSDSLNGRALLDYIKSTPSERYRIPIPEFQGVSLRAVSTTSPDPGDVRRLTEWRNRHVTRFLTEFNATETRTRNWLTEVISRDSTRVLFMIEEE